MAAEPALLKSPSREKILDAAEPLFARQGFAGTGLAEVAARVGLSKSSLFHHFSSKAQLYAAVVARILARIEAPVLAALAAPGAPLARLERAIDTLVDVLAGDLPEEEEANAVIQRLVAALARVLDEGVSAGVLRPASVPHTVQTLIGATVYHFASGEFGNELLGAPLFAAAEVRRRKHELKALLRHGLTLPRRTG